MRNENTCQMRTRAESSATLQVLLPSSWEVERELLIRAINNRTRERNYANLCLRLADGEISEEEFDNEIAEHEDRYVLSFRDKTSSEQIRLASILTPGILDIDSEEDFRELFSISSASLSKAITGA